MACFHPSDTGASRQAINHVPTFTPTAPSISAAAMPRPSKMPPAATTGTGDTALLRHEGHRADVAAIASLDSGPVRSTKHMRKKLVNAGIGRGYIGEENLFERRNAG